MIFAIETSCDETSTAIVDFKGKILSHIVTNQEEHRKFGGVVPELASRAHLQILQNIIPETIKNAGLSKESINIFCATCGPGLIGGLLVGSTVAKAMAVASNKPFYPINHLEGHALSVQINDKVSFPFLLLLISGGHTQFYLVNNVGSYKLLGSTIDDSVGECFDKVAKMINMPYPGGKYIESKSKNGNKNKFNFPKPLLKKNNLDFSFSGLKTAVKLEVNKSKKINNKFKEDLSASFQETVTNILTIKMKFAIQHCKRNYPKVKNVVVAGGVAANNSIRLSLKELCEENKLNIYYPPVSLCGDNAAMIGWACLQRFKIGYKGNINFRPRPRWSLNEII
ncbi:MAG: tRNA N6-adenosine threonylcarbamoyltransferase [Alphaproteobacteria bacterium MarineAlpha5_Bin12]|nr:tRNA (adenosine(37)-N6)-threonylcarbamoyltransferase complex transferase subunit TsaD [Pelagibacteraceae bacterium]PPR40794.1 MAG: tRNA N6-adenosine threonylcarbamoyltransferase [Alphaproteobacteria bacterium MarineAlpha5_Bin12]